MSMEERELQRRLDASRAISAKARELEQQRQQESAQQKRDQESERRKNDEIVEARELAALKSTAARNWPGSRDSFEKFWTNGGADRVRADELTRRMSVRPAPTTLD